MMTLARRSILVCSAMGLWDAASRAQQRGTTSPLWLRDIVCLQSTEFGHMPKPAGFLPTALHTLRTSGAQPFSSTRYFAERHPKYFPSKNLRDLSS